MSQQKQNLLYVLDSFSHRDVKRWKRQYQAISAYCWDHYSYFAHQRSRMADELKVSLLSNSISGSSGISMGAVLTSRNKTVLQCDNSQNCENPLQLI